MTATTIKVKGWKTDVTDKGIFFERGDVFCAAFYRDVLAIAKSNEWPEEMTWETRISCAAKQMVSTWIRRDGLKIERRGKVWWAMVEAIDEATRAAN